MVPVPHEPHRHLRHLRREHHAGQSFDAFDAVALEPLESFETHEVRRRVAAYLLDQQKRVPATGTQKLSDGDNTPQTEQKVKSN